MVNYDLVFAVLFYGLILLFISRNKKDFEFHGKVIALYRTKLGLKWMDRISKICPRFWKVLGIIGVLVGFAGMAFIFYFLLKGTLDLLFVPSAPPAVAPVLPGVRVPGLPTLSFWHWVIAIFVVAAIHEFCHGLYARLYNIKVKSSGFLIFGPILGAFVEPDEKTMGKKSKWVQLSVLAAGPFSNLVLGVLVLLALNTLFVPALGALYESDGIVIKEIVDGSATDEAGIVAPVILRAIDGNPTTNGSLFFDATADMKPGKEILLQTDKGDFKVIPKEHEENNSKGYLGVKDFEINRKVRAEAEEKYGTIIPPLFLWINMLVFWLFIVNIGIGLFNLLPLGPVDGGKMFYVLALAVTKNNVKKAQKMWYYVSMFCLILIGINLMPYLFKLFLFLAKPFMFLLSMLV